MLRRTGIVLLVLSPIAILAPFLVLPTWNVSLFGPISDYPGYAFLTGVALWIAAIIVLLVYRVRKLGNKSLPRSLKIFGVMFGVILVPTALSLLPDQSPNDAAGFLLVGFFPIIALYLLATLFFGIFATIVLLKETNGL